MYFRSQKKTASDVSLSECIETGKDGTSLSLMDVIDSEEDLFEDLSAREMHGKLREIMQQVLTPREREILTLRYGLSNQPPQTQRELAARCGISRAMYRALRKRRSRSSRTRSPRSVRTAEMQSKTLRMRLSCRGFSLPVINHMIEHTIAGCGRLVNRLARDAEARLLIAPDGSRVPRSNLKIHGLSRKELPRQLARRPCHLPAEASAAQVRAHADSEEDLGWLFI